MKDFLYIAFSASLFVETIKIIYKSLRIYGGHKTYKIHPMLLFIIIFMVDFSSSFVTILLKNMELYYLLFVPLLTFCVSIVGYKIIIRTIMKGLEKIGNVFDE